MNCDILINKNYPKDIPIANSEINNERQTVLDVYQDEPT